MHLGSSRSQYLAGVVGLSLLGASAFAGATTISTRIEPAEAAKAALPNTSFQVTIVAEEINSTDRIAGFDFRIDYDRSKVELTNVTSDSWVVSSATVPTVGSDASGNLPAAFRHVSGADLNGTAAAGASGATRTLATLTFTTTASPLGPYDIIASAPARANRDGGPMVVLQDASLVPTDSGIMNVNSSATTGLGLVAADRDGDLIADTLESATDSPTESNITNGFLLDSDSDGLTDEEELNFIKTGALAFNFTFDAGQEPNPRNWDTDGDGFSDGLEVRYPAIFANGPLLADSPLDTDGDGLPDAIDPNPAVASLDSDGDKVRDEYELSIGISLANLATTTPPVGDVNNNGQFQANDVTAAFIYLRGVGEGVPPGISNMDAVANGRIQANDASFLAQRARGVLAEPLPIRP